MVFGLKGETTSKKLPSTSNKPFFYSNYIKPSTLKQTSEPVIKEKLRNAFSRSFETKQIWRNLNLFPFRVWREFYMKLLKGS